MGDWGPSLYGEPCHQCAFSWSISEPDAIALVANAYSMYGKIAEGADGSERSLDLTWPLKAYVCHVGDNLRIWAERLVGITRGASSVVVPYDENLLAEARVYEGVAIEAALWSLERAVTDWLQAVAQAKERSIVLVHPDRGVQTLTEVIRSNAHDVWHHFHDIERCLGIVG